jgi:hypothetical protein
MPARPVPAPRPFPWTLLGLAAVGLLTLALADLRIRFAYANTPNVLFWDQWDIYHPLFRGDGWWGIFAHQHGPHRQGLGGLANAWLAQATGWDARGDAVLTVVATAAATAAALALAVRCGARSGFWLLTVPCAFLTVRQFESWIGPANPAHGAFPLLLTMLYGLTWFLPARGARLALQAALVFLLAFTGFGLFAAAIGTALCGWECWQARREPRTLVAPALALLAMAGAWALFLHGYQHQPAAPNFQFPHERPWEYLAFAALMLASYAGVTGPPPLALAVGGALLAALTALTAVQAWRALRAGPATVPAATVLAVLAGAVVLYCLNTAVGRVGLGWREAPYAPRYVTLVLPGILALFVAVERLRPGLARHAGWALLAVHAGWAGLAMDADTRHAADWYRRGREHWRAVYLATGSQAKADAATSPDQGFTIYPADLGPRLEHLRRHRLNLFKPEVRR